jgi:hypothetical protein
MRVKYNLTLQHGILEPDPVKIIFGSGFGQLRIRHKFEIELLYKMIKFTFSQQNAQFKRKSFFQQKIPLTKGVKTEDYIMQDPKQWEQEAILTWHGNPAYWP